MMQKKQYKGCVLWFTGLSGSGKSTLAETLYHRLKTKTDYVEHIDGDNIRSVFPQTGFSFKERDSHGKRVGYMASLLERHGIIVLVSLISPYRITREWARNHTQNFIEIYISTSLEVCEKRDVKGLYQKARMGEIPHFTSIQDPYEVPNDPELIFDTEKELKDDIVSKLELYIEKKYAC